MSTYNEKLRKAQGGVVGRFIPIETAISLAGLSVGDTDTGLVVPKGKMVVGAYIKNPKNDVVATATGSQLSVKVGSTTKQAAVTSATIKGIAVGTLATSLAGVSSEAKVYLTIATNTFSAGEVQVGVIYA